MSDTSTSSPDASDGAEGTKDAPDGTDKTEPKKTEGLSEGEKELIKRRDAANKKAREATERADGLQSQLDAVNDRLKELDDLKRKSADDDAARQGDIEKLRKSASERERELLDDLAKIRKEKDDSLAAKDSEIGTLREKYLLEAEMLRRLDEVSHDPHTAWLILKDRFELAEDENGRLVPRVKDSTLDPKTFAERELESTGKDYLLRNRRKAGTGTETAPEKTETKGDLKSAEQLDKMTSA
jgi:hypothetical protein